MKKIFSKKIYTYSLLSILGVSQATIPLVAVAETATVSNAASEQTAEVQAETQKSDQSVSVLENTASDTEDAPIGSSNQTSTTSADAEETQETKEKTTASENSQEPVKDKEEGSDLSSQKHTQQERSEITDNLLKKGTLLTMTGEEYSQTDETRTLNNTPVRLKLDFELVDKEYPQGSTFTVTLPENLGFSNNSGTIDSIDASWQVDSENRQLTIVFGQGMTDATFSLDLKSYLYTDSTPQIKIQLDDIEQTMYPIDLYEEVNAINYVENKSVIGLDGTVYYNLDRNLSGSQTLSLALLATPGAVFSKNDLEEMAVYSYEVDIKGNVNQASKTRLTEGTDYAITGADLYNTAITLKQMDRQKAYGIDYNFEIGLEAVSDSTYYYYKSYPTTGFGSVSLKPTSAQYRGLSLWAKTSKDEKEIYYRTYDSIVSGSLYYGKGSYALYIHQMPTKMKAGEQIVITSQNGQVISEYQLNANTASYKQVEITDYFEIVQESNVLTLTAKKDSNLRIGTARLTVPFDQKNVILTVSTPITGNKAYKIVEDEYVQPLSILNPNSAETAWGNYYQNGAYASDTSVNIDGSSQTPLKDVEIFVEHPDYLSLRQIRDVNYRYKLGEDYTITPTDGGTLIRFTTPITTSAQVDIGFNYVPDSLSVTTSIPVDIIPVTIKATGCDTVETTVRTGRRQYSERTLQSSKNQFLLNARQDTLENLSIRTKVPKNTEIVFAIYDVSNDQVDSIYPQYWDRGQYADHSMEITDEGYPVILFDESTNQYTFDFGKTNKRYIIECKYANGWQDNGTVYVSGSAKEPLYNNQEFSATVQVTNTATDILGIEQNLVNETKNLT